MSSFLGLAVGMVLGGALLKIANGFFDRGPSRTFPALVTARNCGGTYSSSLTLRGAPVLPIDDNSIEWSGCGAAQVGDTVVLAIRPGFLGRPWIASYRVQTADDRVRQLLQQRRHNAR